MLSSMSFVIMVKLTRIYTKTGDHGTTALANNERENKNSPRIICIGAVDEANSAIGMIDEHYDHWINPIQQKMFDLGAELAKSSSIKIVNSDIENLEKLIDELNEDLPTLQSFILPKGDIHHARAVVRRAELKVWWAMDYEEISELIPQYLNRLSDLLFVLARHDATWRPEVLWRPSIG